MTDNPMQPQIDALILTALQDELEAVLGFAEQGLAGWTVSKDQEGFRCYQSTLDNGRGGRLRIAAAWIGQMGERTALMRAQQLFRELDPQCLAMCGICAGYRKKVTLGDVVVADRLYSYDEGKIVAREGKPREIMHDLCTFDLPLNWRMDAAYLAREIDLASLSHERPISKAAQRRWLLAALLAQEKTGGDAPSSRPDRRSKCPDWTEVVREAQKEGLLTLRAGQVSLTSEGREQALNDQLLYPDGLPDDPPLLVHVGAIATGVAVQEDPDLFERLRRVVRTTLGAEMEGVAIGQVAAHFKRRAIVVKAVSDYADSDKDDSFRHFACRASASVLINFLLKQLEPAQVDGDQLFPVTDNFGLIAQLADPTAKLQNMLASIWEISEHLTTRRWGRISRYAPPQLIQSWAGVVDRLRNDRDSVVPILVTMWEHARVQGLVPYVPALHSRFDPKALSQLYIEKKPFWICQTRKQLASVAPHVHAREAEFDWAGASAWQPSHTLAGPLFELVWEVLRPLNRQKMVVDRLGLRWWNAVGGVIDAASDALFAWPTIEMLTFSEYEQMAMKWNKEYSRAVRFHELTPVDDRTADDLASWFVDYHHTLWHKNAWASSKHDWTGTVSHLFAELAKLEARTTLDPEDCAYAEWTRALPLMAAPESGLSREAASAILAGITPAEITCMRLHELRLRRARECRPGSDAEETIAAIDAEHPDHPWVQQVKRRPQECPRA